MPQEQQAAGGESWCWTWWRWNLYRYSSWNPCLCSFDAACDALPGKQDLRRFATASGVELPVRDQRESQFGNPLLRTNF